VSLAFLSPSPHVVARSPMERQALAAGARLELRDGWNVARFESDGDRPVGFADLSHLTKLEVHGRFEPGRATREGDAWWCPYTADRAIVLGAAGRIDGAVDVTCVYAALAVIGPFARELFARFTALDLRPHVTPVGAFRPGSVARTPGAILRVAEERYVMLFGAALGEYMWTVVADAAARLGGGPVGADA
jgi:glycine cleavage system aminomethyltransferase T